MTDELMIKLLTVIALVPYKPKLFFKVMLMITLIKKRVVKIMIK